MGEKWQPQWQGLLLIIAHRGHAAFTEYTADIMHVSLYKYVTQKQIYVGRVLSLDFSGAFNTSQPAVLRGKLGRAEGNKDLAR